mgnify:CR=1 FL=1
MYAFRRLEYVQPHLRETKRVIAVQMMARKLNARTALNEAQCCAHSPYKTHEINYQQASNDTAIDCDSNRSSRMPGVFDYGAERLELGFAAKMHVYAHAIN